jgi:endonuclease III
MPQTPRYLAPTGFDPEDARVRVKPVTRALARVYPHARTALHHCTPWELLIATILSAQSTDVTVNSVTPHLFERYPDVKDLAGADTEDVERIIYPTGFFRQKTKAVIATSRDIVERFDGNVPTNMADLTSLRGVARKTANVVLANCCPRPRSDHGIFVDTHIRRVSQRLAFTDHEDPEKIEQDLMALLPQRSWVDVPHQFIELGRGPCDARRPNHADCPLLMWCPTGLAAQAASPPTSPARGPSGARSDTRGKPASARRNADGTSRKTPRRT